MDRQTGKPAAVQSQTMVGKWLREPLLHFLLLGGSLFAADAWLNRGGGEPSPALQISSAEINWLQQTWSRQWHRQPTAEELRGLLQDYLKESLLAREAKELGLDENDTVIRRRLAQKMAFMVQDTARLAEPGESVLQSFYTQHRQRYLTPARVSFAQQYFPTEAAARQVLPRLQLDANADFGSASLLERDYAGLDELALANLFGDAFAKQVLVLPSGRWAGPVKSGYGWHLLRISELQAAQPQPFSVVRNRVLLDWQQEQQVQAEQQFFAELLKKYRVATDATGQPDFSRLQGNAK